MIVNVPIKKPWRIVSWGVKFDLPPRNVTEDMIMGSVKVVKQRFTQTYTQQIVDIILKTICRGRVYSVQEVVVK